MSQACCGEVCVACPVIVSANVVTLLPGQLLFNTQTNAYSYGNGAAAQTLLTAEAAQSNITISADCPSGAPLANQKIWVTKCANGNVRTYVADGAAWLLIAIA